MNRHTVSKIFLFALFLVAVGMSFGQPLPFLVGALGCGLFFVGYVACLIIYRPKSGRAGRAGKNYYLHVVDGPVTPNR